VRYGVAGLIGRVSLRHRRLCALILGRIDGRESFEGADLVGKLRVGVPHCEARFAVAGQFLMGLHADRQASDVRDVRVPERVEIRIAAGGVLVVHAGGR